MTTSGAIKKIEPLEGITALIRNAFRFAVRRFQDTFERFPLAVLCIAIFYILGIFDLPLPDGWHWIIFLLSYCGTFWFISIRLYSEAHGLSMRASNAVSLVIFLPMPYLALVSQTISEDALGYAFPMFFVLMFIAPFLRRNATCKEMRKFYNDFWGHIGRTIPIVFVLFMIALAIFFGLYPVFNVHLQREKFAPLSGIILDLLFPLMALMGIPKIQKKSSHSGDNF